MASPSDAFAIAASGAKLAIIAATMQWHPLAWRVFWFAFSVVLTASAWLESFGGR